MSNKYDFVEIYRVLNEMEKCANRITAISREFHDSVQEKTVKKAA